MTRVDTWTNKYFEIFDREKIQSWWISLLASVWNRMVTDLPLIAPTNGKSVFKQTYTLSSLQINSNTCKKYRFTRVLLQVSEHLLKYESESIPTFLEVHFSESGIQMRIHFGNVCKWEGFFELHFGESESESKKRLPFLSQRISNTASNQSFWECLQHRI